MFSKYFLELTPGQMKEMTQIAMVTGDDGGFLYTDSWIHPS